LKIKDFGPESVLRRRYSAAQLDKEVSITYNELANALTGAEADSIFLEECGEKVDRQTKIIKRRREQTPMETISTSDEDLFLMKEAKVAQLENSQDTDYVE